MRAARFLIILTSVAVARFAGGAPQLPYRHGAGGAFDGRRLGRLIETTRYDRQGNSQVAEYYYDP